MKDFILRLDKSFGQILRVFSWACLAILFLVLSGVVLIRFLPLASLSWSDEVVEWAFAWMVFVGAAALWRERDHFRVDTLLTLWANKPWGWLPTLAVELLSAIFAVIFTYYSYRLLIQANDRSPLLEWPRTLWYAAMPLAGAIMVGYSVRDLVKLAVKIPGRRAAGPEAS